MRTTLLPLLTLLLMAFTTAACSIDLVPVEFANETATLPSNSSRSFQVENAEPGLVVNFSSPDRMDIFILDEYNWMQRENGENHTVELEWNNSSSVYEHVDLTTDLWYVIIHNRDDEPHDYHVRISGYELMQPFCAEPVGIPGFGLLELALAMVMAVASMLIVTRTHRK